MDAGIPTRWRRGVLAAVGMMLVAGVARAEVRVLDTAALRALLARTPAEVFLLDVRTPREYRQGRIPGAVLIPMNLVPERLGEIPRERKVVAVCASGARSGAVARYLDQLGYPWVANYAGGVADWSGQGQPLER